MCCIMLLLPSKFDVHLPKYLQVEEIKTNFEGAYLSDGFQLKFETGGTTPQGSLHNGFYLATEV